MKFCPQCGTKRQAEWRFCAQCRLEFAQAEHAARATRPGSLPGIAVFAVLVLFGVGTWMQILSPKARSGPSGSPDPGTRMASGASLPEGHPPLDQIVLPDDVKQFIADLTAQAEQKPDDKAAWERLSQAQIRAARIDAKYYAAAAESFRHVLELDPENPDALRGLAGVHYDRGEYREAKPHLEKYLTLQPEDPAAQNDLATVRLHLGDPEGAIADYRKIIAANPPFVQAHFNLGVALHRTGDQAGALAAFRRAREVTTDDRIRVRLDNMIAQLKGTEAAPQQVNKDGSGTDGSGAGGAQPQTTSGAAAFQKAVEQYFRSHAMIGEKIVAIEWPAAMTARVVVRDFPMDAMPPFARSAFTNRLRDTVREAKVQANARGPAEVTLVDSGTQAVMETVRE